MKDIKSINKFVSSYKYKIELHAHTNPCSGCSMLSPEEMMKKLKEHNYHAVVITNHFFYDHGDYLEAEDPIATYLKDFYKCREIGEKEGIKVLLGAEYRFLESNNDYLVLGIDKEFLDKTLHRSDLTIESFYKEFHNEDLLIIHAHPYRENCGSSPVNPEFLDGVEIMNMHPGKMSENGLAAKFAKDNNISLVTIGTDLHRAAHAGVSALRTKVLPQNEKELVKILKSKDYIFEIGGFPMIPYSCL